MHELEGGRDRGLAEAAGGHAGGGASLLESRRVCRSAVGGTSQASCRLEQVRDRQLEHGACAAALLAGAPVRGRMVLRLA